MNRFILDCDPGHDDAVAMLVAARYLNLVGITTVFGNSTVENTTRNALAILEAAHLDIPVAAGAAKPLQGALESGESIHGRSGLDGANFPAPTRSPVASSAVEFIVDSASRMDDLVILAVAPLTNIALALEADANLTSRIRSISIMGGSIGIGNATPVAEFNIFADPEAADRVFSSGIPITMAGLNVTTTFGIRAGDLENLKTAGGVVARELSGALSFYLARQTELHDRDFAPLHDVCAVLPFSHPTTITHEPMHVGVECKGELTRGMTVCDQRAIAPGTGLEPAKPPNALVAVSANGDDIIGLVLDTLSNFP